MSYEHMMLINVVVINIFMRNDVIKLVINNTAMTFDCRNHGLVIT